MSQQTLLVLAPHPDDAEFYAGGTIARYVREGMKAFIIIATDGRCGSFELTSEQLVPLRTEEATRAAKIMGAETPILLGHPDMGLDRLPAGFLREQFIRLIRQYQPHLTISEDPSSTDEVHPDHRVVAWTAAEAVTFASLPLVHPEHLFQGLKPHFTPQKYFYSESPSLTNKVVDITSTMEIKLAALKEHRTQVKFLVEDVKQQAALSGINLSEVFGIALDDPNNAIAWAMKVGASQVGQSIGVEFAEAFRTVRFHPLVESVLGQVGSSK